MILARVAKKTQPAARGTAAEARRRRFTHSAQGKAVRTYGHLFDRYANFDALHDGYLRARLGCRDSRACMRFELRLEENLIDLLNHLHWGSYRTGPYRHFYVHEPKDPAHHRAYPVSRPRTPARHVRHP